MNKEQIKAVEKFIGRFIGSSFADELNGLMALMPLLKKLEVK